MSRKIKVALADDHTMFRQGLREMLSTDPSLEVTWEAANGAEVVELARTSPPDVLILDVEMPIMGAGETMQHLGKLQPPPRIIIVTMFEEPRLVRELLAAGASAYLVKSASLEELLAAVHAAVENPSEDNVVLSVPRGVLERSGKRCALSERELEVLLLAARGLSNRKISVVLHLSEATVKRHLANIYAKLGVTSRSEAARRALSEGWISTYELTREG
ncbi:response regulator transcription factor [Rubrobacter calidifluminis]|uniref:response regulator transcription factor n=1 Tax=Rubrobacter calidifluminis TaxID=1392640 RepID=UPI00236093CA|nr:response regulator transcription factor [Rubrobacter calidifluminis]